jgi:hypothetical protein
LEHIQFCGTNTQSDSQYKLDVGGYNPLLEKVMARSQQKAAASIRARDLVFLREGESHYNFLQQQKATNLKMI